MMQDQLDNTPTHLEPTDFTDADAASLASLDTLETNSPFSLKWPENRAQPRLEFASAPATAREEAFRHTGWRPLRKQVWNALCSINAPENRLYSFMHCGANLFVYAKGDEIRLASTHCHDRWCIPCQRQVAGNILRNLREQIKGKDVRFVTLTLRHSPTPLPDQIDRLYRSFLVLRRRRFWTDRVQGGAAFCEVKVGRDGLWHVHLHILAEGTWMSVKDLAGQWWAVTGDSMVVDIRKPTNNDELAAYVTKYVTKPTSADVYRDRDRLQEIMISLKGRRLCTTFGTWRKHRLTEQPELEEGWTTVGSLHNLVNDSSDRAYAIKRALLVKYPDLCALFNISLPPPGGER